MNSRNIFRTAVAAMLALGALSVVHAEQSITASLGLESGACFDGADVHPTRSVSVEYRRDEQAYDAHAYVRNAPTGLDCTQNGLTVDLGSSVRWGGDTYAVAQFAAKQIATVGSYSLDGAGQVWRYAVDGAPTYTAALGVGRAWGGFSAELTANAVPTDWVEESSHGPRLKLAYAPEVLGGDLLLQLVSQDGRRNSALASWTRPLGDGPGAVTIAWRHESGLAELASPFAASLAGGYQLAPGADFSEVIDIGFTVRL